MIKSLPVPHYGGPVEDIEDDEEDGEDDKECEVGDGVVVLLPLGPRQLPHLHLEQDACVLHQGSEHEHDTRNQPSLNSRQTVGLEN